jgi:predicted dehydrogenase
MDEICVGVVGAGYWGINLVRCFSAAPGCRLKAVCDVDPERLRKVSAHLPWVATTRDYSELLLDEEMDGVAIALPAGDHYAFARECLEAGKHALVEKPLALRVSEAEELVGLARTRALTLMVGHTFLYNEAVRYVKRCLERKELGEVYYVYSQRLNLGRVRQDVDAMWNLAPHDVSMLIYWLESLPVRVSARGFSYLQPGIRDVAYLDLEFAGGASAHVHVSWLDPGKVRRTTLVGSEKMIVYDDVSADGKVAIFDKGISRKRLDRALGEYDDFGKFQLIQRAGDVIMPKIEFVEPLQEECADFVDSIRERRCPLAGGESGSGVVRVLEAAQQSFESGGTPIAIS